MVAAVLDSGSYRMSKEERTALVTLRKREILHFLAANCVGPRTGHKHTNGTYADTINQSAAWCSTPTLSTSTLPCGSKREKQRKGSFGTAFYDAKAAGVQIQEGHLLDSFQWLSTSGKEWLAKMAHRCATTDHFLDVFLYAALTHVWHVCACNAS